jgi:hypothetical protein
MGAAPTQLPPGAQPQQGGSFQPGGPSPAPGGMGGTYPGQAAAHAPNVGYQAPVGAQGTPPATPGGWQQPQVNPQQAAHAGHAVPGQHQPSSGQAHGNVPNATTYPSSPSPTPQPGGPASGPAAQASAPQSAPAVPAGAHYTQAQQASPTAYPGSNPSYPSNPVHGFAHGNPTANG